MRGARRLGRCPSTPLARHSGRRRGAQLHRGGPAPRPHPVGGLADDWPARAAVRPDADRPQAEAAGLDRRRHGAMRSGHHSTLGAIALVVGAALAACASPDDDPLLGEWHKPLQLRAQSRLDDAAGERCDLGRDAAALAAARATSVRWRRAPAPAAARIGYGPRAAARRKGTVGPSRAPPRPSAPGPALQHRPGRAGC